MGVHVRSESFIQFYLVSNIMFELTMSLSESQNATGILNKSYTVEFR